ncbi:MAG: cytochrome-c oxidase, cbb3-type subunit III [Minwuia sp.]|uniref:cytochrome-c oxidase, cbb3-type subunit III n=1 Tax=Minwuia sp. TaxID=2493630 RepID=UPI003A83ADD2
MSSKDKDDVTGIDTTGHEWDGIKELNNPLPRWWLYTFYITIIWAIGYTIAFPAWPLISEATPGLLGYSSRAEVEKEISIARAEQADLIQNVETLPFDQIRSDAATFSYAVSGGRAAFLVNCSQCHGSGAQGSPGYPNLNDDDWLWGGTVEDIYATLQHGIRYERDDDTRFSQMPAFGRDGILDAEQVEQVAHYVVALSGGEHEASLAEAGKTVYDENCAACHGEKGLGDQSQGAPNLADPIALYGSGVRDIQRQVHAPQHGVMPAWNFRLQDATLKQLAIYVHSLGGGE